MATVCTSPAETVFHVSAPICVGVNLMSVVPSPKFPYPLSPHAQSVPSVLMAMVYSYPAATVFQLLSLPIFVGLSFSTVVPSPNWLYLLFPHPQSVPSFWIPTVCKAPAEIWIKCAAREFFGTVHIKRTSIERARYDLVLFMLSFPCSFLSTNGGPYDALSGENIIFSPLF